MIGCKDWDTLRDRESWKPWLFTTLYTLSLITWNENINWFEYCLLNTTYQPFFLWITGKLWFSMKLIANILISNFLHVRHTRNISPQTCSELLSLFDIWESILVLSGSSALFTMSTTLLFSSMVITWAKERLYKNISNAISRIEFRSFCFQDPRISNLWLHRESL